MKAILGFIVTRRVTSSLGPTLVLSALVWLGSPQGAQAGINEWTSNGPYGGSVSVLVIDPQTPSTLYAGANNGIYKSTDAGASWTNVLSRARVEALAIDPQTPTTLYVGARFSGAFGPYPRFVKSTDGGATWGTLNIPGTNGVISALAIDPQTPATLYAGASNYGTFKSTDGGASWTAVLPVSVSTLGIDPRTPAIVYAGGVDSVYRSSDGGSTWSAVDLTPEPNQSVGWVRALAIDPLTPTTLYAGAVSAGSSSPHGGLFKSTNGGATWSALDTGSKAQFNAVAIDPWTPTTLYAGIDRGVLRSLDGGSTWSGVNTGLPDAPVTALAIDPRTPATLYAGGVAAFKSTDGGDRWRSIGLSGYVPVRALAIDPVMPTTLYAVTENLGLWKSTDGGDRWNTIPFGGRKALAIDPLTPATLYATTGFASDAVQGTHKSTDGGASWSRVDTGPNYALAIDPLTPTTVYTTSPTWDSGTGYSTAIVRKSIDGGTSWTESILPSAPGDRPALAIDPQTPSTLYAGTRGGLFKSIDGGISWTGVLPVFVSALAIDPQTPAIVYAGTGRGDVYKSIDEGSTWNAVNIGLTDFNVSALAVDPRTPTTLYAGTCDGYYNYCGNSRGGGVFKSTDGGATWYALNAGLRNLHVSALVVNPQTPTILHAATADGVFSIEQQDGGGPAATTANFDTPTPPGGPGPLDGVFEGIAFGTGQWAWEGPYGVDSTNNIYFAAAGWQRLRESAPEVWSVGEPN